MKFLAFKMKETAQAAKSRFAPFTKKAKAKEAEMSTAVPQLLRGKNKESAAVKIKGAKFVELAGRFKESTDGATNDGMSARVVIIEEGLGNLADGYFYLKEALKDAFEKKIFEGKKMFADHPDKVEEETRPERSTRDIVAHYENVKFEEGEGGVGLLTADLMMMPEAPFEWARALIKRAVDFAKKFPDQEFIGLSINASGEAEPVPADEFLESYDISEPAKKKVEDAINGGLNEIKAVHAFQDAVSVDLVTEAGAKGKILELLEAAKMATKVKSAKQKAEDLKKLKEAKAKLKEAEEAVKEGEEAKEGEEDAGANDDEDADKALIVAQLKKHGLVKDDASEEESKETMEAAGHYMAAFKKAGHKSEEAASRACEAMKCSAQVHEAMNPKDKKPPAPAADDGDGDDDSKESKESKVKEAKVLKLEGELASLRETVKTFEVEKYIDKKLKESKLSMSVTKKFRESLGKAKTEKEVDEKFSVFMEGFKSFQSDEELVIGAEKSFRETNNSKEAVDLSDCVDEE